MSASRARRPAAEGAVLSDQLGSAAGFKPVPGSQQFFTLGGTQVEETQFLLRHAA